VREVQDTYIQEEILDGFDVSVVFDKRDGESSTDQGYYDFKTEIGAKEELRTLVGEANSSVISQLERWWDKYHVSLHQLDEQVATAESVMKGYLAELGYE
jgi:type I restriction enzyme M protein